MLFQTTQVVSQVICGMHSSSIATHPCYIYTWNKMDVFKNNCSELGHLGRCDFSSKVTTISVKT